MKTLERPASPSRLAATPGGDARRQGIFGRILGSEWRLPIAMGLVLAVVTAVPYLYGYFVQPQGHVFIGFFYLGDDANTYLAKMRQGWEGSWA